VIDDERPNQVARLASLGLGVDLARGGRVRGGRRGRARGSQRPALRVGPQIPSEPQYFSYQWERYSVRAGAAIALADFDANGEAESKVVQRVECDAEGKCWLGDVRELRPLE
jgi:hypothetical protein